MKAFLAFALLAAAPAFAQDKAPDPVRAEKEAVAESARAIQKEKIGECNWQAGERKLTGSKRREFMSECLSESSAAGASSPKASSQPSLKR